MTKVIHIREAPPGWANGDFVYIGRAGKGHDGFFGNPFILKPQEARGKTLEDYKKYFDQRLKTDVHFMDRVLVLRGKTLVCFCRPKDGFQGKLMCHGQVIAGYLDNIPPENVQ